MDLLAGFLLPPKLLVIVAIGIFTLYSASFLLTRRNSSHAKRKPYVAPSWAPFGAYEVSELGDNVAEDLNRLGPYFRASWTNPCP